MFGKLHRTAEENHEGLGMGLMICKAIVAANAGTIKVRSAGKDQGSAFVFTMHMERPSSSTGQPHISNLMLGAEQSNTVAV